MTNKQNSKKWWQTVPGILTAIAGTITAITGLIIALHQTGIIGGRDETPIRQEELKKEERYAKVPPYTKDSVNIWVIGSPHRGDIPSTKLPTDIDDRAKNLGIDIVVKAIPAKDFAEAFFEAFDGHAEPDIIAIDNFGHIEGITTDLGNFVGIASRTEIKESLVSVVGSLETLGRGWQFLIATSPNQSKAKALVTNMLVCDSEAAASVNNLSEANLEKVKSIALASVHAYLTCNEERMRRIADKEAFRTGCTTKSEPLYVGNAKICGVPGNGRLAFVSAVASIAGEKVVDQMSLLEVMRNREGTWKLLVITHDPVSLQLLSGPVQSLSETLIKGSDTTEQPPESATLITPDWEFPEPKLSQRFGNFMWRSSASEDVVAELVEFDYESGTRLFLTFGTSETPRELSTGKLWTTRSVWKWRVWSISKNGRLALSDYRSFRY